MTTKTKASKEFLRQLAICPECGTDWESMQETLETAPVLSESYHDVLWHIFCCPTCKERFTK